MNGRIISGRKNRAAAVSLIAGIISSLLFSLAIVTVLLSRGGEDPINLLFYYCSAPMGLIGSVTALIAGTISLRRINRSDGGGKGITIAGIIMAVPILLLLLIFIIGNLEN